MITRRSPGSIHLGHACSLRQQAQGVTASCDLAPVLAAFLDRLCVVACRHVQLKTPTSKVAAAAAATVAAGKAAAARAADAASTRIKTPRPGNTVRLLHGCCIASTHRAPENQLAGSCEPHAGGGGGKGDLDGDEICGRLAGHCFGQQRLPTPCKQAQTCWYDSLIHSVPHKPPVITARSQQRIWCDGMS